MGLSSWTRTLTNIPVFSLQAFNVDNHKKNTRSNYAKQLKLQNLLKGQSVMATSIFRLLNVLYIYISLVSLVLLSNPIRIQNISLFYPFCL